MNDSHPSAIEPSLTQERLSALRDLFRSLRQAAYRDDFDPSKGDNKWSLGCKVYARSMFGLRLRDSGRDLEKICAQALSLKADCAIDLEKLAATEVWSWLSILSAGMRFIFSIDGTPIRFYTGAADKPKANVLKLYRQTSFGFMDEPATGKPVKHRWLLALNVDADGSDLSEVYLVQVSAQNKVLKTWSIGDLETVPSLHVVELPPRAAIQPFAPAFGMKKSTIKRKPIENDG